MRATSEFVRSGVLNGYVELVQSLGGDPYRLIRSVGMKAKLLEDSEMLIPRDAVRELLELTARKTQTEDLALRLAAQRKLSALGPVSLVLREDPTPRAALETLRRYLKLVNASLTIHVEDAGSAVIVREDLRPTPGLPMRQSVELAVGTIFRALTELIGPRWRPLEVCFTHRPPSDVAAHRAFFKQNVKFNQEFDGLVCAASDLSTPREVGDEAAGGFARKYLESVLADRSLSGHEGCRQIILALLPNGACTSSEVARLLQIDRRTLHRRLEAEGLTFVRLLDSVRSDLVVRYLRESDLPLSDIAQLLGFARLSSFSYWFHHLFGRSASQWKKEASGTVGSRKTG
ncbi:MAG: AraC family transcriptional regulator [Proteobacteria bacterium]|nr:AraC family transcriptional regulator [Pseudomonadota bacterium]